jgi:chemotaxis protein MotB
MKRDKSSDFNNIPQGSWLTTYADLMNNLLVLFIMLYMMSTLDLQKFRNLTNIASNILGGSKQPEVTEMDPHNNSYVDPDLIVTETEAPETEPENTPETEAETEPEAVEEGLMQDLDEFVNRIAEIIRKKGYGDQIDVERIDNFVYLRIREGVLFYPDLSELREGSYDMLRLVADIISEAYNEIYKIDVCGHTAWVPIDELDTNFNSWRLSSDRSLTVIRFFVSECKIPKDKMVLTAYSSTDPYTEGKTEEEKAMNRRVEIRLSRLIDQQ